MIRLVAFDLDGTILDEGKLHDETIATFHKLNDEGIILVPATGRSLKSLIPLLKRLGIYTNNNYAVLITGAMIQNVYTAEVVKENTLIYDDYLYICELLKEEKGIDINFYTKDSLYYKGQMSEEFRNDSVVLEDTVMRIEDIEDYSNIDICRINVMGKPDRLKEIEDKYIDIIGEKYYTVRNAKTIIEIINPNASKGNGLMGLIKALGIQPNEVITIGDGNNDITMLEAFPNSFAMGNASDYVKSKAKYVTDSVENEGFSKAMELLIKF